MPDTPRDDRPPRDDEGRMGSAPGVEAVNRARIRAAARAKLFGEPGPASSQGAEDTDCGTTGAAAPPATVDPERIGRFRILDRLGAGGMGVVFSAYDPELDRKVALKLLRPELAEGATRGSTGTSRLQREAQAMARLNHPNVVTVHEVGRYEDQVFVAMEFVDGMTLGQWAQDDRDWQDVVRIYCDAAAGLEAAHAAGIVHRDFKPDNVMLGKDGRVRVMDFGLSRSDRSEATVSDDQPAESQPATLTQTGAVMGTPAYMAPEQHSASPTTAACDQFAFCVSLWESLTGIRPFAGRTYGELAGNVVAGRIQAPPGTATAPRRIFDALRTGLATDPEDRFGSMSALVAALRISPFRTLRRVSVGLAAVGLSASAVYIATRPEPVALGACDEAGAPLHDFWEGQRTSVEAAILRSEAPYAAATWSSLERMLGSYVDDWARASRAHCTMELVQSASAATLERQAQCLASRRSAVEELVAVLSTSEEGIAQQAVQAVVTLAPVEACADPRRLEAFSVARAPEA
ncbi:MAG: serine/threonine protein kinase, partial [Nannocystaceae bacterium]|nr:serine/threonine protein kinase [Nannocystaceae bacterium]